MSDSQESRKEAIRFTVVDCIARSGDMLRSHPIDNKLAQAISEAVVARVDSIDKGKTTADAFDIAAEMRRHIPDMLPQEQIYSFTRDSLINLFQYYAHELAEVAVNYIRAPRA